VCNAFVFDGVHAHDIPSYLTDKLTGFAIARGLNAGEGTGDGRGRRFLIATAITHYAYAPQWDRPGLVDGRNAIIDVFTGLLGYQHVSDLGLNPTKDQLTTQLRRFCRSVDRQPDDMIAVYIAGHGEVLDDQDHVLLTSDTDPDDLADALPTVELTRKMLLGTPVRRVLLMLDACYSARAANDIAAAALRRMPQHWDEGQGSGLVVINSAQAAEQAQTGIFPRLFREAVEGLLTAGYTPSVLALDAVVRAMNDSPSKPGFQTISSISTALTGEVPPFLPNPRHAPRMTQFQADLAKRKVFISYVREDLAAVDRIAAELRAHDIDVWLDRTNLDVGDRWKDVIRRAIRDGDYFLAYFSRAYSSRQRTYMNEELLIAIEELRLRPRDRRWFLPVTLGRCIIPAYSIGVAETLEDIHYIDLSENWQRGLEKLIRVLTPEEISRSEG
jgi:hypothetical protein